MSWTQGGPAVVKVGQTHRRHDVGEARDGGASRKRATGHGRGCAWARWRALAPARRTVVVVVPEVAGVDVGELGCARRGSVVHGNGVGARRRAKRGARDALRGLTNLLDSPG